MIGEKIKKLRKEHCLLQRELGEKIGVKQQTVYSWEKNISIPKPEQIKKICAVFNVTMNELYGQIENKHDVQNVIEFIVAAVNEKLQKDFISR